MQPVSEFRDQLFVGSGGDPQRILNFSCDHVVPKDNILPLVVQRGPSGALLDFSYQNRDRKTMEELGRSLFNLCNVIPGGMVVFFPSYTFEADAHQLLESTGMLEKLGKRKRQDLFLNTTIFGFWSYLHASTISQTITVL